MILAIIQDYETGYDSDNDKNVCIYLSVTFIYKYANDINLYYSEKYL